MYNKNKAQSYPCYGNTPGRYNAYGMYPYPYWVNASMYNPNYSNQYANQYIPFTDKIEYDPTYYSQSVNYDNFNGIQDYGPEPFVVNIEEVTKQNKSFRTALWTGDHLQVALMSINAGEDIGLEVHPSLDQFIRIEEGNGLVQMGEREDQFDFEEEVSNDFAIVIPAGKWHNLTNTGDQPLKLYSIYAPPEHPHGTVHENKTAAESAEENNY